jgi:putative SOS response-associated peptidase YedK
MCGRFAQAFKLEEWIDHFQINHNDTDILKPSYNIAPTHKVPCIVLMDNKRIIKPMRWGLIPSWEKNSKIGAKYINARKETVKTKPVFKNAFYHRRCIIPATGFYEWKKSKHIKQAYFFTLKNNTPMAFAGIWEEWQNSDGDLVNSFSIITTHANKVVLPVHSRMPILLNPAGYDQWLDIDRPDNNFIYQLVADDLMTAYPVSSFVNKVSNNSPHCIQMSRNHIQKNFMFS